jgi:hypothetical protein
MGSSSSILGSYFLVTSVSATLVCLPYEINSMMLNSNQLQSVYQTTEWDNKLFDTRTYKIMDSNINQHKIIIDFATKLVNNQRDIDGDINKLVNENFWDLV